MSMHFLTSPYLLVVQACILYFYSTLLPCLLVSHLLPLVCYPYENCFVLKAVISKSIASREIFQSHFIHVRACVIYKYMLICDLCAMKFFPENGIKQTQKAQGSKEFQRT